jgi:hypothetical protein
MAAAPGVLSVARNEFFDVDTSSTPAFLGLSEPGGLWEQLGGVDKAGEDVIVGIVDSGIWPESLSFSDRTDTKGNVSKRGTLSYRQIPGLARALCARGAVQCITLQPEADRRSVLQRRLGR